MNLNFIRDRRKGMDLTLAEMAKGLGLKSPSQYYKYEMGEYKFKAEMLPALAKMLNCEIEKFF